jgi:tryptophan halogenase
MQPISKVVIVGGGTAGWITAAVLTRVLARVVEITLIESESIGTVGVGEATIPPILSLNRALGIDEGEFLRATRGTIKLGIQFEGWRKAGHAYMHAFGGIGKDYPFCSFHHLWNRYRREHTDSDFWEFSLNYQAAKQNRFAPLARIEGTDLAGLVYAYHFDASAYAGFLRRYSEERGVRRIEGRIEGVELDPQRGDISALRLDGGEVLDGQLFIDCSGFRGLLIEQALHAGYESWEHWLPCNRAMAVQTESVEPPRPYTRSIAHAAGWRWQIPLQHRSGNGLVFCDRYLDDETAAARLLDAVEGTVITEPRAIPFHTGRRRSQWLRNCVAIGLSSGFLEPLESTSIHLIQTAALRLARFFPHDGIRSADVAEFNRKSREEFEHVRDFIILHYKANGRTDSEFWKHCARMEVPDTLAAKMEQFRGSGQVWNPQDALFSDIAWQQVMLGQGIEPEDYHPLASAPSDAQLDELMSNLRRMIAREVGRLPGHAEYLEKACGGSAGGA